MRGGTTLTVGQLLEAAEQEAQRQKVQGQTKVAQAAPSTDTVDMLSTNAVMALAQAGRKLASKMKLAEDDMGGSSGVNTGGASGMMADSMTPSADAPNQFFVAPTGKVDVSPSANRFSIPTQTDQKVPEESGVSGLSSPEQFLAPKIGQSAITPPKMKRPNEMVVDQVQKSAQRTDPEEAGTLTFSGGGPLPGSAVNLAPRSSAVPEVRPSPQESGRRTAQTTLPEQEKTQALDPIRAVHDRYSRAAAALAKQAQPGGTAQPSTESDPMAGGKKPEATSTSSDTSGGDKPPTSAEGVADLTRQDADAKALADASSKTDLPVSAAKETTEGVLEEVLKAASSDQAKAAAFREWFSTLPEDSKVATLIRNRLAVKQREG